MNVGDFVKVDGQIGLIILKYENKDKDTYHSGQWDWEVVAVKGRFPNGCKQDCYYDKDLELYDWKDYPKTVIEKLKLLVGW